MSQLQRNSIPESKWFGTFSLVLLHDGGVKKPRRRFGVDYVFRLATAQSEIMKIVPNYIGSGIVGSLLSDESFQS